MYHTRQKIRHLVAGGMGKTAEKFSLPLMIDGVPEISVHPTLNHPASVPVRHQKKGRVTCAYVSQSGSSWLTQRTSFLFSEMWVWMARFFALLNSPSSSRSEDAP